jgi:hypothetical protein
MTAYRFRNRVGAETIEHFESDDEAIAHARTIDRLGRGVSIEREEWRVVEFHDVQKAD